MKARQPKATSEVINSMRVRAYMVLHKVGVRCGRASFADSNLERAWLASTSTETDVETALRYGDLALRRGEVDRAIEAYTRGVGSDPTNSSALYKLGFALERAKDWVAADATYQAAQHLAPDAGNIAFRRGRCLNELGDFEDAVAQYHVAIRGGHRVADAYSAVYLAEATAPLWKRLDTLRSGSRYHLDNPKWLCDRAVLAARMGKHTEAIEHFLASDSLSPLGRDHKIDMARCYQAIGRTSRAAGLLQDLAASDGGAAKVLGPGAFFRDRGYWSEAIALYEWKLKDCHDGLQQARLAFEIGHAYDRQYLWSEARDWFLRSLVADGSNAYCHYRLGVVLERLGENDRAIGPYASAIQLSPDRTHWYYRLGVTARKAGRTDEALRALKFSLGVRLESDVVEQGIAGEPSTAEDSAKEFLRGLDSEYAAQLDSDRRSSRPTNIGTWQESYTRAKSYGESSATLVALRELDRRRQHMSRAQVAEYVDLLVDQGSVETALDALEATRDVRFPDGLDLKKYLKGAETRRRSMFAEFQETLALEDSYIFLESNHGASIGCHPLALFREMTCDRRFAGSTYVWAHSSEARIPDEVSGRDDVILVEMHSDLYLKYLATSKYLINNVSFAPYFVRRADQVYLNTWHGTPLKALGKSMKQGLLEYENLARNFVQATHVSSPNELTDWALFSDHRIDRYATAARRITGSPRLDRLVSSGDTVRLEIRGRMGLPDEEKVVLYAPTWRGGVDSHEFDIERLVGDLAAMASVPGYRILFRAHRLTEKLLTEVELPVEVVPGDIDTNDLLAAVDMLVTDYSSIAFDFLTTGRPIIFYAPDYEEYVDRRGLYLSLEEFPGRVCASREELMSLIAIDGGERTPEDVEALARFVPMEDGSAARRTIDFMLQPIACERKERPLLVFHASLIPNGIASALLALFYALEGSEVDIVLVVEGHVMRREEGRQHILERLPEYVNLAFRIGNITATPEEQWAVNRLSSHELGDSDALKELRTRAWRRESYRVLGLAEPATAIEFDGYATLWADFVANVGDERTRHLIWQHNQLVNEWRTKYPELAELFSRYDGFDTIVPVSQALSEENREKLLSAGFGSETAYEPVPNVLDAERIESLAEHDIDSDLGEWLDEGHVHVVSIGRLSPEKNFRALVDAWPKIVENWPNARLTIIGTGLLEADLLAHVDELEIADSIYFAGQRSNPYPALKRADLFVLPSVHEGQPIVVLEAMTLGVPIAAAFTPGTAELLESGYGLIIDHRPEGLARDISRILGDPCTASGSFDASGFRSNAIEKFVEIALGA